MLYATAYHHITAMRCCQIIRTPAYMKRRLPRPWISMAEILRVIREAYVLSKSEEMTISNYKADGAIGGGIAFAIVGDHENRPTDMTNLVVYETDNNDE